MSGKWVKCRNPHTRRVKLPGMSEAVSFGENGIAGPLKHDVAAQLLELRGIVEHSSDDNEDSGDESTNED